MELRQSAEQALLKFRASMPEHKLETLQSVSLLFEKMVANGVAKRPTYDLEPITTLSYRPFDDLK